MLSMFKYAFSYFYGSIYVRMWNYGTPRNKVFFETLIVVTELRKIFSEFNGKGRFDVKLYFH